MKSNLYAIGFLGTTLTLAGAISLHASWMPWWYSVALLTLLALRLVQRSARPARVRVAAA